jgi:hypothetical protein
VARTETFAVAVGDFTNGKLKHVRQRKVSGVRLSEYFAWTDPGGTDDTSCKVTHLPTGRAIAFARTLADAKRIDKALRECTFVDWSTTNENVLLTLLPGQVAMVREAAEMPLDNQAVVDKVPTKKKRKAVRRG